MTTTTDLQTLAHEAIEATERLMDAVRAAYDGPPWPEALRAVNQATEARRAAWARVAAVWADRCECPWRKPSDQYLQAEARYQEAVEAEEQAEAVEVAASEHERRLRGWAEAVEAMRECLANG